MAGGMPDGEAEELRVDGSPLLQDRLLDLMGGASLVGKPARCGLVDEPDGIAEDVGGSFLAAVAFLGGSLLLALPFEPLLGVSLEPGRDRAAAEREQAANDRR